MAETALQDTERSRPSVSSIGPRSLVPDALAPSLALAWLAALDDAGARVPADPGTPERIVLTDLASSLVSILFATPFEPEAAGSVGRALVTADFTGADVLGRSLRVLMLRLPVLIGALAGGPLAGGPLAGGAARDGGASGTPGVPADLTRRLAEVTGALADGYVRALQTRTLAEAEAVRRAELDAERAASRELLHQATHDPLTGLPNRAEAFGRLSGALASAGPGTRVGLCFVDLDGFKAVNDRHGHGAGDELLTAIAERIGRVARAHGALAARIGGDEFLVLAEASPGLPGMIALAADILAEARRPVALAAGIVCVSACAGIVDRLAAGASAECVVADADSALYEAKSRGGGRWSVYQPSCQRRAS